MASAEYLPIASDTCDNVISTQMLEHVKNLLKVILERIVALRYTLPSP